MSCEKGSNKIAKLAARVGAGIAGMSSKQAFYAGVAVGAVGAGLSVLGLVKRDAIRSTFSRRNQAVNGRQPSSGPVRQIPVGANLSQKRRRSTKKITTLKQKSPRPIPALAARSQPTKLQAAPVEMQVGEGQRFKADNSYRVLRQDGSDTGLALTPHLTQKDRTGLTVASDQGWGVTHVGTGALLSGPYQKLSETQELATKLAPLRWTATTVPASDVERAKKIIQKYQAVTENEL